MAHNLEFAIQDINQKLQLISCRKRLNCTGLNIVLYFYS